MADPVEDRRLQDTLDYVAITRLQNAYADAVTRRAWSEFHDMFLADAPVRVDTVTNAVIALTGPQEVGDFIGTAVERFEFFEFVPLSTRVELRAGGDPDRATARLYICELRQDAASGQFFVDVAVAVVLPAQFIIVRIGRTEDTLAIEEVA